jgi:multidrug efflux pump subunit AcrB
VLGISVVLIFLALVFQFKNAVKPFIVFAAVPYGMVGALAALWLMGEPFGFMAFLGIVSLVSFRSRRSATTWSTRSGGTSRLRSRRGAAATTSR